MDHLDSLALAKKWTLTWSKSEQAMEVSVTDAKAQLTELVRQAERGAQPGLPLSR